MKINNLLKRSFITMFCFTIFACSFLFAPQTNLYVNAQVTETTIQPRAEIKEWVYNIVDGKLYKRLYNKTKAEWEGDWIFVCNYPQ